MKYIFILGNNPELSVAEIKSVFPALKSVAQSGYFFVGEGELDCQEAMARLGGTVKIGEVINNKADKENIIKEIIRHKGEGKIKFGFSFYGVKPNKKIGMAIKKELKKRSINSRLVVSREKTLSSVIVKNEKCLDFLVGLNFFGVTCAVQDFEDYGERDYGRPRSDARSGMLPPKLAKMMINLSGTSLGATILDPFCGSGTILTEAAAMGFRNLIGCDISEKAVRDTKENLEWLIGKSSKFKVQNSNQVQNKNYGLRVTGYGLQFHIFQCDVRNLSDKIKQSSIDAIITEPYLGPPLKGGESEAVIKKISGGLEELNLAAFREFKKVLKNGSRIVIIFPEWHLGGKVYQLDIFTDVAKLGFNRLDEGNLVYKREGQKVWRRIGIWNKI